MFHLFPRGFNPCYKCVYFYGHVCIQQQGVKRQKNWQLESGKTQSGKVCGPKKGRSLSRWGSKRLTSESVQSPALPLQSVDDVHSGDGLPLGMLGVGDGITDDIFQEHFKDTTSLFVDQTRDSLDTASASQTSDGGLGDTLDVVTKNFSVTLSAPLSKTFPPLPRPDMFALLSE